MTTAGNIKAWKLGGQLSPCEGKQMTNLLDLHKENFAFSVEDLGGFKGEPIEVPLTTDKPIFNHAHKLGETEWEFVGANCEKLAKQGLIRVYEQTKYAAATVVVRKRDENGDYTVWQCGDYRPLNSFTELDRYPLPAIEGIF